MENNDLVRVFSMNHNTSRTIRHRQCVGTMQEYFDEEGYVCFSKEEFEKWKPRKAGRKPKFN